jgi:FixJ family two-component response regulator
LWSQGVSLLFPEVPGDRFSPFSPGISSSVNILALTEPWLAARRSGTRLMLRNHSSAAGRIDILLTDVVMPGLGEPDLHRLILAVQPEIQVLFVSGYAEGLPEMQLPRGASFLQKPFCFSALLQTRKVLQSSN